MVRRIARPLRVCVPLQLVCPYNAILDASQTRLPPTIDNQARRQASPKKPVIPSSVLIGSSHYRVAKQNKPVKLNNRRNLASIGFSLVELLIAIAIIGVLSAIAIPAYNGYIENNKINTTIADIGLIQVCIERYYTVTFQYPPNIAAIASCLPNNGNDPWGNPYVYLNIINAGPGIRGQVRKDHATNPINTLYDLYSMGKDGDTHIQVSNRRGQDDIILGRDGAFVGLGKDF